MQLDTIFAVQDRLEWARAKHPDNGGDEAGSIVAILNEAMEVLKAYRDETPERVRDEVLDVIATCVRFLQKEYEEGRYAMSIRSDVVAETEYKLARTMERI